MRDPGPLEVDAAPQDPWPLPFRDHLLDRLGTELAPSMLLEHLADADAVAPSAYWRTAFGEPLTDFLARPSKMFRARITAWSWVAAGGSGVVPPPFPLAVEALHAGSLIVDDIQDGAVERRGDVARHLRHGIPIALNAGNAPLDWDSIAPEYAERILAGVVNSARATAGVVLADLGLVAT